MRNPDWARMAKVLFDACHPDPTLGVPICGQGVLGLLLNRALQFDNFMQAAWRVECERRYADQTQSGSILKVGNWRDQAYGIRTPLQTGTIFATGLGV
jgi:hypothetical protein